jgi:hypothetical protein
MKQALISPNESRETGYRVAEVAYQIFEVGQPLFWVECSDNVVADRFFYDQITKTIQPIPQPVVTNAQTL